MSLTINQNSAATSATRYLTANNNALGKSIEKLSSGYRVNTAADDPAGLVISEKLRAQIGGLGQAISNSNDAINMVKTAEGALNETHSLLLSMRDLAVHAANTGANDSASTAADQLQIKSAIDSLNRISTNTQFGNKKLLDGSAGTTATVIDATHFGAAAPVATTPSGYVEVNVTGAATQATLTTSDAFANAAANNAANVVANAGTITINGTDISIAGTDKAQDVIDKINTVKDTTGVAATWDAANKKVVLTQANYGSDKGVSYTESAAILNSGNTAVQWGTNAVATVTYGDGSTEAFNTGKGLQLKGVTSGTTINLTTAGNRVHDTTGAMYVTSNQMTFQVGAYAGQTVDFALGSAAAGKLGITASGLATSATSIADIDVTSKDGAQDAIKLIDAAITEVSTTRAGLGAFQKNILESNVNSLSVAQENISASEASIRDTNMATEMVNYTRNSILQQTGVSMLAQANQAPQSLLKLLQ